MEERILQHIFLSSIVAMASQGAESALERRLAPLALCHKCEYNSSLSKGGMEHAMDKNYVEYRDGVYHIINTRVTLDSLVYAYWEGHSPETIAQAFRLDHEQVYGALTFYLAHQQEVDDCIRTGEVKQDALRAQFRMRYPALHQKLAAAKRARAVPQ